MGDVANGEFMFNLLLLSNSFFLFTYFISSANNSKGCRVILILIDLVFLIFFSFKIVLIYL